MYCQKCGKEIAAGSVFCTWCGARQEMPIPQPEVIPQESPAQPATVQENAAPAAPTAVITPEAPTETPAPEESKAEPAAETPQESAPAPETAPDNAAPGAELPKDFFGDEIKLDSEAKPGEKPQKYYTTAHLVICLAAAGIMAAAAGIFAGLYFSVIG